MDWLSQNWVWILIGAAFIGAHLFGHGYGGHGHSGHGRGGCGGGDCGGKAAAKTPLKRLASDAARAMTGCTVHVDAGYHIVD